MAMTLMDNWMRRWSLDFGSIWGPRFHSMLWTPHLPSSPHHLSHLWAAAYAVYWVWAAFPQLAHLTKVNSSFHSTQVLLSLVTPCLTPAGSLGGGGGGGGDPSMCPLGLRGPIAACTILGLEQWVCSLFT